MTRLCRQPANDARGDNLSLLLTDGDIRVIVVCYLKRVGPPFPLDRVASLCNSRLLLLVIFDTTTRVPSFDSANNAFETTAIWSAGVSSSGTRYSVGRCASSLAPETSSS